MSKYSVVFSVTGYAEVTVEASSVEEAQQMAWDKFPEDSLKKAGLDDIEADCEDILEVS